MPKKTPAQDTRTPLEQLFDSQVRPLADQQIEEAREQIEAAFKAPPASPDDVDGWFEKNFHQAPVSHDVTLFNQLQGMKAAIRIAVSQV